MIRIALFAAALTAVCGPALAQEASFANPTPIDFSRPFLIDTQVFVRGAPQDEALPVEVIGSAELLRRSSPTMEELVRALNEVGVVRAPGAKAGGIGVSTIDLRHLNNGFTQEPEPMAPRSKGLVRIDDQSSTDGTRP